MKQLAAVLLIAVTLAACGQSELGAALKGLEKAQHELETTRVELETARAGIGALEVELGNQSAELERSKTSVANLGQQLRAAQVDLADARSQIRHLESFQCQTDVEIDYTSNSTVSASLKEYLASQESIDTAKWETIWNNSKVTRHELTGEYLWVFIVSFDDPDFNLINSVYDVSMQCLIP